VNQSARTVIGPDPTVRTDELVVPEKIAKNLTIPERVTLFNIERLNWLVNNSMANFIYTNEGKTKVSVKHALLKRGTELLYNDIIVRNGQKIHYNSAKNLTLQKGDIIIRDEEEIKDLILPVKKFYQLEIGDIVHRQLQNGDLVLLNRQPTLHKNSMLAKRIIIRPGKTFRFALAATKQFNADFDGDCIYIE
jgi:DNA-directed RNA polymerase beta' subunit